MEEWPSGYGVRLESAWEQSLAGSSPVSSAFASPKPRKGGFRFGYGETQSAMEYVYLLKCRDDRTYIGCTSDLKERIERHKNGQVPATKDRLPVKLTSYFAFADKYKAFDFEKYLKSGSGRAFINRHLL